MEDLEEFIKATKDARELKRALAVKLTLMGRPWKAVRQELEVSRSFISKWRSQYKQGGVNSLSVSYHGWDGYLTTEARTEILAWVKAQNVWDIQGLIEELRRRYNVEYKSLQSYYALFAAAGISWKKVFPQNPRKNLEHVLTRRKELKKFT
jgi:putative transposase